MIWELITKKQTCPTPTLYYYYYIQMQIVTCLYRIPDKLCEESIQI